MAYLTPTPTPLYLGFRLGLLECPTGGAALTSQLHPAEGL